MQIQQKFQHVVPQNHPYFELLAPTLNRLATIFEIQPNDHASTFECAFPLKMFCRQKKDVKYATFIYFFTLPVTSHQYIDFLKNFQVQKQIDTYMDQFKIYKDTQVANTQVLYLAYKKMLIVSPRYFIYVRYYFTYNGDTWIIAISDPSGENIKDKTRGEIVVSVTRIHEVEGRCQISVFSQTDMKMNLKFQTARQKGFAELKKYLLKVHDYLSKQQNK